MTESQRVNLRTIDLRGTALSSVSVNQTVPRASVDIDIAIAQISELLTDVKSRGAQAIIDVTIERDGVDPQPIKVSKDEMHQALAELEPSLRKAI